MSIYSLAREAVRKGALSALVDYPAMPVIYSHLNGTEPAESYVVVQILSLEQQGQGQAGTLTSADFKESTYVAYEVKVQYSFCGSLSGDAAYSFNQRINNLSSSYEGLRRYKLGVMRKSAVRRAPQKRDTQWVEYHNMDVTFSFMAKTVDVIDYVNTVVMNQVVSDDGSVIENTTYTVPKGVALP